MSGSGKHYEIPLPPFCFVRLWAAINCADPSEAVVEDDTSFPSAPMKTIAQVRAPLETIGNQTSHY